MFVLYVVLMKPREGKINEAMARRLQWQPPKGMRVIGEYWTQSADLSVVSVIEADSIAPMLEFEATWDDVFGVTFIPAVSAEEGMELAKQMMG